MHFFNPAPVMKLVEVVAGEHSGEAALETTRELGRAMGKHVIDAADGPGFLVNRCNRPFGLEALRLVQEGLATVEQVDRICRLGGGFRMGPFELMDLVGIDVGFEVSKSFYAQSFGEPRWRPSMLAARKVASGDHGRKTGRGWYAYPEDGEHRPPDPDPPQAGGEGLVVIGGWTALADELREAAEAAGWRVADPEARQATRSPRSWSTAAASTRATNGTTRPTARPPGRPAGDPVRRGLARRARPRGHAPRASSPPPRSAGSSSSRAARPPPRPRRRRRRRSSRSLGRHVEWVGDAPGLVLGRIVAQLVNEACFALGDGVGAAEDIDAGMVLGLNHPRGPLEWGDAIGASSVLGVLAGLYDEYREERYRPAPALLRAVRTGTPLRP